MSKAITFDTLRYAKKLREAGVSEKAAEVQAEALKEVIEDNLATKSDIWEVKRDIEILRKDIEILKRDLTLRIGAMFAASISILSFVLTVLNKVN
jgi:hypothetical protein